jgi:ribonuclease T2
MRSEKTYATTFTHEEIGSFCYRSPLMGGESGIERAEREWAQSEVGEGVEEVWERAVSHSHT